MQTWVLCLLSLLCACTNVVPEIDCDLEDIQLTETASELNGINGSVIDGRYFCEDGSFSIGPYGASDPNTVVTEQHSEFHKSVFFSNQYNRTGLRYDIFPIDEDKIFLSICCDASFKQAFLKIFLNDIIIPQLAEQVPTIQVASKDYITAESGEAYYLATVYVPSIKYEYGNSYQDCSCILVTVKGRNLVMITLEMGFIPEGDFDVAKERLHPALLHYIEDFTVERT